MELTCPPDATLVELVEGSLDEVAVGAIEEHIDRCPTCRRVVAELGRSSASAATPWTARSVPPPPVSVAAMGRGAAVSRYLVIEKLGAGGMGVVFAAYDPELDRKIALKVLRADLGSAREEVRSRFVREARAMALISHPNVITVHDVGSFGDDIFVAMELVAGGTLASHLPRGRRRVAEILDLFARAGAGLAAAHAAGLVHRDFKPENVLIGDDGRVRVTDFGLVRRVDADPARGGAPPAAAADGVATTHAGARLGTPAYMAPEQHEGRAVDARSDQFAFCVALFEALYGERPFAGDTPAEIASAVSAGRMREPPRGAAVPAWIRPILRRGLSVAPADRFPSMEALLAALRWAPARRGPRIAAAVVALLAVVGIFAFRRAAPAASAVAPCRDAAAGLAEVWNDERRQRIMAAFQRTAKPFAADGAREVVRELDAYAAAWTAARTDACEATRVRGEQSDAMLDLRAACFDRRARSLEGLVTLLGTAGPDLVTRGVDAVRALPRLDRCAASALATPVARPTGPGSEARLAEAEARLAQAQALEAAGKAVEAEAAAASAVELCRAVGYAPLLAEAFNVLASVQEHNEHDAESEKSSYQALWAAEAGHADPQSAQAWTDLVYLVGYKLHRFDEGARLVQHAQASIDRIGGDDILEIKLLHSQGAMAFAERKLDVSASHFERAIDLASRRLGPDDGRVAMPLNALAAVEVERGEHSHALVLGRRALGVVERAHGPDHPEAAVVLDWLAHGHWALGQYDEALAEARRALAVREAALAPDNPWTAFSHSNLADVLNSAGHPEEAIDEAELSIASGIVALGARDERVGVLRAERARALLLLGRIREATEEARAALALCVVDGGPRNAEAWVCHAVMGATLRAGGDLAAAHAQYRVIADDEEAARGPDHPAVAVGLTGMGRCEIAAGHLGPAVAHLERALQIREAREGDPADRAETQLALADALWRSGEGHERAAGLGRKARDTYAAMGAAKLAELSATEAWLTAHRTPSR